MAWLFPRVQAAGFAAPTHVIGPRRELRRAGTSLVDRRYSATVDGGYEVDTGRLRDLANTLQAEADDLKSARPDPIPKPDAGRSTTEVAAALTRLVDGATDLVAICTYIAENVTAAAEEYERQDATAADHFHGLGRGR